MFRSQHAATDELVQPKGYVSKLTQQPKIYESKLTHFCLSLFLRVKKDKNGTNWNNPAIAINIFICYLFDINHTLTGANK
ncbi:hypothetical protein PL78_00370 [Yersinia entomophaga]|uniref:Uncharacterized protein n=1 Tax=Yersinia entomophaga TaxID=935293 RepID=A0ABN4PQS5_YERET|nr:hypothetical protein PL78_00370 [Yersinia entomophaga]OWF88105.1 hypothetical protein B4914_08535 [Yersinia entomophaga]